MTTPYVLNVDLANVYSPPNAQGKRFYLTTIAWGDEIEVDEAGSTDTELKVTVTVFKGTEDGSFLPSRRVGYIKPSRSSGLKPMELIVPRDQVAILKVNVVDVQQGDAAVIESPKGKVVFIDGGEKQLFARYLANRFLKTSDSKPRTVDAIVVTHGDADHFAGLSKIAESESDTRPVKRIFIRPKRVFHNGLVKRPSKLNGQSRPESQMFGATTPGPNGSTVITDLADDLLTVPDTEMNEPFQTWKRALTHYRDKRGPIDIRRLEYGMDSAFDFLATEGIDVKVLGPMLTDGQGGRGLKFLGEPRSAPQVRTAEVMFAPASSGLSASHTINGHSIVLQLTFGKFRFLFAGDLNSEAETTLVEAHERGDIDLQSDVLKVPHHGSSDFAGSFLAAVAPVISVVSSGDENAAKEYIHPRATLVGSLGKHSRLDEPVIFVTELIAFFEYLGTVTPEQHVKVDGEWVDRPKLDNAFSAFRRAAYGIVKIRTDGDRLLVYTNSGQKGLKEAYAFRYEPSVEPGAPDQLVVDPVRKV